MRPALPAGVRPFRAGALCLLAASCLGLAVGTLGFGPGDGAPVAERGGHLGQVMADASTRLFSDVGAHIWPSSCSARPCCCSPARPSPACCARLASRWSRRRAPCARRRARATSPGATPTRRSLCSRPTSRTRRSSSARVRGAESSTARCAIPTSSRPLSPRWRRPGPSRPSRPAEAEPRLERQDPAPPDGDDAPHLEHLDPGDVEFRLPDARILKRSSAEQVKPDTAGQEKTMARLVEALGHLGVQAQVIGAVAGPHITRYELQLAPGVKMAKVANLKNDLAYALAATEIRILAPIPGKRAVGVEVPNRHRRVVTLGDVFSEPPRDFSPLTVWLGKDVSGKAIPADLAKMPHLLVAGTTGAGKSGAINAMLSSICCARRPTTCASCSSTPSRSSSTTTRPSRICSRRSSPARAWPPTRCRTSCARWSGATA
jgi:S-DNA-T family DNA segregation ATPase FtsK/SpoIIIE